MSAGLLEAADDTLNSTFVVAGGCRLLQKYSQAPKPALCALLARRAK